MKHNGHTFASQMLDSLVLELEADMHALASDYGGLVVQLRGELQQAAALNLAHMQQLHSTALEMAQDAECVPDCACTFWQTFFSDSDLNVTIINSSAVGNARTLMVKCAAMHQQTASIQQLEQHMLRSISHRAVFNLLSNSLTLT